jgi:hypothetical protein
MPAGKVLIGQDGWLFLNGGGVIKDYLGQAPLKTGQLQAIKETLEKRRNWLAQRGVHYLLVIVPYKAVIYSEMLPEHISKWRGVNRLDQVLAYLKEHSDVQVLDLTDALLTAKEESGGTTEVGERIYFPHDIHWNDRGALAGYREICRALGEWAPGIHPFGIEDFQSELKRFEGGLAGMMGMGEELAVDCEFLTPIVPMTARRTAFTLPQGYPERLIPRGGLKLLAFEKEGAEGSIIVFHDSYFASLARTCLKEHFQRSVFLHTKLTDASLLLLLDQEHPDIVIEEWSQTRVDQIDPAHPSWDELKESSSRRNGTNR